MENYRKGFPFSVFLSGAYRLHLILWYKFYHLHNIYRRVRQGELPEGQEKVPWGMTPSRRFSSNDTNFINLYPSTAAFILHFPLSILNSPLT